MKWCTLAALLLGLSAPAPAGAQPVVDAAELEPLVTQLQSIVETSDTLGFLALLAPGADVEEAREFARDALREEISAGVVLPRFLLPSRTCRRAPAMSSPSRCSQSAAIAVGSKRGNST